MTLFGSLVERLLLDYVQEGRFRRAKIRLR